MDIDGDVMIDKLVVKGNVATTGNVFAGGLDLLRFLDSLVLKSSDQVITGEFCV